MGFDRCFAGNFTLMLFLELPMNRWGLLEGRTALSMPILDEVAFDSILGSSTEPEATHLATAREELARLRYMLILTARWESSDRLDPNAGPNCASISLSFAHLLAED